MKRRGFTLIELLVVIAIIAILAAILFPVFARARENARKTTCINNCKQWGTAAMMYAQDYDEVQAYIYQYDYSGSTRLHLRWWVDNLQPYTKNYEFAKCPSGSFSYASLRPNVAGFPNPLVASYGMCHFRWSNNAALSPTTVTSQSGTLLATIQDPAGTFFIVEWNSMQSFGPPSTYPNEPWIYTDLGRLPQIQKRHMDGFNAVFCDGHAKWVKQSTRGQWTSAAGD